MTSTTAVIGAAEPDEPDVELEPAPFKVLADNIIVELIEREEETESGILLVQEKQARPPDVTVVGIGAQAYAHFEREEGVVVGLGTVLIVRKNEGLRLELGEDGRELYVYRPGAVLGVVS